MAVYGYFGAEARYAIEVEQTKPDKKTRKVRDVWFCGCGDGDMYPLKICRHLRTVFEYAHRGKIPPQFELTGAGEAAAAECACMKEAREKGPKRRAVPDGTTPARSKPCPCGSGHKFKKCHGRAEGPPEDAPDWPGPAPMPVEDNEDFNPGDYEDFE